MASYPGNVRVFAEHVDLEDVVRAAHMNDAQREITATQQALGSMPQGTHSTVRARLESLESSLAEIPTGSDPYPQYLTEARHAALTHGFVSHNALSNLASGDPHPQYLTQARGDARYAQPGDIPTIPSHNNLSGLTSGDPHTQYLNQSRGDNRYSQLSHGHAPVLGTIVLDRRQYNAEYSAETTRVFGSTITVPSGWDSYDAVLHVTVQVHNLANVGHGIGWLLYFNDMTMNTGTERWQIIEAGPAYSREYTVHMHGTRAFSSGGSGERPYEIHLRAIGGTSNIRVRHVVMSATVVRTG